MMTRIWTGIIACAAAIAVGGGGLAASSAAPSRGATRADATIAFGQFNLKDGKNWVSPTFTETKRVQMVDAETGYGWRMTLPEMEPGQTVKMREVLTLPDAPAHWGISPDVTISTDRRRATTRRSMIPHEGVIQNIWIFSEGDPRGIYTLDVFINGEAVATEQLLVY